MYVKSKSFSFASLFVFALYLSSFAYAGNMGSGYIEDAVLSMNKYNLTDEDVQGLIKMREEEKLAHDVYVSLYDRWGLRVFNNIANSESTHTSAVKALLDKYNIEDPYKEGVGEFSDENMKKLYNDLVEKGNESLLSALTVGATIEDLDIYDLEELLRETDAEDIKMVYENLMRGSRNHMRAFYRQIEQNGGMYEAQYISQEELEDILSGDIERGNHENFVDENGSVNVRHMYGNVYGNRTLVNSRNIVDENKMQRNQRNVSGEGERRGFQNRESGIQGYGKEGSEFRGRGNAYGRINEIKEYSKRIRDPELAKNMNYFANSYEDRYRNIEMSVDSINQRSSLRRFFFGGDRDNAKKILDLVEKNKRDIDALLKDLEKESSEDYSVLKEDLLALKNELSEYEAIANNEMKKKGLFRWW